MLGVILPILALTALTQANVELDNTTVTQTNANILKLVPAEFTGFWRDERSACNSETGKPEKGIYLNSLFYEYRDGASVNDLGFPVGEVAKLSDNSIKVLKGPLAGIVFTVPAEDELTLTRGDNTFRFFLCKRVEE